MARVLFFGLPLHGHVHPSLLLVAGLADRGDDVVYFATAPFRDDIERAGAVFRAYRDPQLAELKALTVRTDELSWLLMRTSARVLEDELPDVRAMRPDYVIADSVAPWGQWIGRILGVPVVTSVSTFAFNRKVMTYALSRGIRPKSAATFGSKLRHMGKSFLLHRRLRRRYGVDGPGVMASVMGRSGLNVVYTSRYFQPRSDTFDERYEFVGPMLSRVETTAFAWERVRSSRVVYVSLGTLFNDAPEFFRACFDAFAGEDFDVVVSTGGGLSPAALGPAPPNVIVERYVPQLDVLGRASAFVTHGGMNSAGESLSLGVPLVVIPQMGEQALVGARIAELGAGLCMAPGDVSAANLRSSVRRVLEDESFRTAAAAVRRSFDEAGGVARALAAISAYVQRAAPATEGRSAKAL